MSHNPEYSMMYVNRSSDIATSENGFPVAENLSLKRTTTSTRGPSLYAQKYMKKSAPAAQAVTPDEDFSIVTGTGLGSKSWKREISEIKHQNKQLIDSMSVEEIEAKRAELLQKLNPKTVAFLQSKQFKYRSDVIKESEQKEREEIEKSTEKLTNEKSKVEDVVSEKLAIPIEEVQTKKYANMSVIEKEKLSWLGDIPKKGDVKDSKGSIEFSARFNFEGDLIDPEKAEEIDVHEGLHHHGDEADRPGYTVNELFMYLQSSFPSQKQIALKVFEKIISKAHLGVYDAVFNANLTEYLLKDTPLVLVVRTCLDDTGETIWKCAISTLKALLCNTLYDELFLDRGYLLFEDYLGYGYRIDLKLLPLLEGDVEIDEKVTDEQYAMYDLVGCLLTRTSILQRFAYLINSFVHASEDVVFVEEILDILIRMGRHSKAAAEAILQSNLIDALSSQLINRSVLMGQCRLMHCKAFKLLRVCISSIKSDTGADAALPSSLIRLFDRFNDIAFIDSLNLSLSLNPEDVSQSTTSRALLQISIESLRTWLKLLSFVSPRYNHAFLDVLKNNFRQMFPFFVKILNFCKSLKPAESDHRRSTFDFQFASCIFTLVKMYHEILGQANELAPVYSFDLFDIAMRWLTLINADSIVPDFDTCTCLLVLTEFILKHRQLDDAFLRLAFVSLFCENDRFGGRLFELCRGNSNTATLKQETQGTLRDSANHPSFGAIYFKGARSVPLLNADSPICLLNALVRVASSLPPTTTTYTASSKVISRLSEYIALVTANISRDFASNIFDLIEINIVSQACLLIAKHSAADGQGGRPEACRAALRFALHLNILNTNAIKRQIVEQVLFNHQLYATLSPSTEAAYSEAQFTAFRDVYRGFSRFETHYWLFHPLLAKAASDAQMNIELEELLSCLQFIHLVTRLFPEHLPRNSISNSSLFLFISSVFLVDDGHFFNEHIQALLKRFLQSMLQTEDGIVCSNGDTIPGYGNVVDFFGKFVDQFENCSYGDPVFCNYLLVFFQPKCSTYFRNFFLSEHSSVIRVVLLNFEQLLLPMESLLFPLESNLETLEIYLRTLLCELLNPRACPVLYCMLIHHLSHALFRESSPIKARVLEEANAATGSSGETDAKKTGTTTKWKLEKLIRSVEKSSNEQLRRHLYEYSHYDSSCTYRLALIRHV